MTVFIKRPTRDYCEQTATFFNDQLFGRCELKLELYRNRKTIAYVVSF